MGDWEEIIKAALPAIAGFYAGHQGQLGPYSQGLMQSQHQIDQVGLQRSHQAQQESWHQEQIRQQNIDNDRQQAGQDALIADRATERQRQQGALDAQLAHQQAQADQQEHARQVALVNRHFENAGQDYTQSDMIRKLGPGSFSIDIDGIGPVNLERALKMGAGPFPNFGEPKPESLVPTPGPDGPVYGVKRPGGQVYERPTATSPEALVPIPGPEGKPVFGKRVEGQPVYERPTPSSPDALAIIPGPGGKPIFGPKVAGQPAYERPLATTDSLVPVPGPGGKAVYGNKVKGAEVYEKSPADKPVKPVRHVTTYQETDPNNEEEFGKTFKIVTDENGDIISKTLVTPGEIKNGKPVAPAAPATPAGKRIGRFEIISVK